MKTETNNKQIIKPLIIEHKDLISVKEMMKVNNLSSTIKINDKKSDNNSLTLTLDLHSEYQSNIYMELDGNHLIVSDIRVKDNKVENIKDYFIDLPDSLAQDSTIIGYKNSDHLNIVLQKNN